MKADSEVKQVMKYLERGFKVAEISKLMDKSTRTITRIITENNLRVTLTPPQTIHQRAIELIKQGFSYSQIANKLKVSKASVYLWNRADKEKKDCKKEENVL
jgi:transposase